ncbi:MULTISPECIES: DMT family transporter [Limnobaculum]|uniref:DMT family transporter n=1 Tax=Limnobaculum TaxID=2172100 RepID=UPI0022563979|nr:MULTISPECIES: EamA family transporter [Limnobaculum]
MKLNLSAVIALICITCIWSYSWIVMKTLLVYIGPFDFAAIRCTLGAVLLLLVLKLRNRGMKPPPLGTTFIIGVLQTVGMVGFSQWALITGGAGKVAILAYTMPFWVILLAALFLNERLVKLQYWATAIAICGMILILQPWNNNGSMLASILALLSGFCWGASVIIAKRLYLRTPTDLLSLTTWQMVMGAIVLVVIALFVPSKPIVWHPYLWGGLLYNAVLATAVAWVLWMFILKHLPASVAGLGTLAVPVCSALLSWWLLGERPNGSEMAGIICVVMALVLVSLPKRRSQKTL